MVAEPPQIDFASRKTSTMNPGLLACPYPNNSPTLCIRDTI
jgi:hypothetical protein